MKNEIIIIGAGLAGLSASLSAVQSGASVTLVSSHPSERAQSVMAEGGINAALNTKGEDDTPEEHYQDTLKAGCYLADPNAVRGLTSEAPSIVKWLLELGVQFNMQKDGRIDLRNFGGQKKKRTAFAQSDSGKQIMTALIDAVRKQESLGKIKRLPHHRFRTLLISGDTCYGCVLEDTYSGEILEIKADAVIVATGGMHGLFANTTGSLINTGAVAAELFRLGIPMANLEMIQYHPTTAKSNGKRILITEAARGEGASLFSIHDKEKCYFMKEKYPELGDLMPRDITAREIYSEMKTSDVFLDMTIIPEKTVSEKTFRNSGRLPAVSSQGYLQRAGSGGSGNSLLYGRNKG